MVKKNTYIVGHISCDMRVWSMLFTMWPMLQVRQQDMTAAIRKGRRLVTVRAGKMATRWARPMAILWASKKAMRKVIFRGKPMAIVKASKKVMSRAIVQVETIVMPKVWRLD